MADANPFLKYVQQPVASPVPALRPVGPMIAKPVDPMAVRRDDRAEDSASRSAAADARAADAAARRAKIDEAKFASEEKTRAITGGVDTAEAERTAAFLATRIAGELKTLGTIPGAYNSKPSIVPKMLGGIAGQDARNLATDETRQRVEASQINVLDAALTLGTGAAYTREQIDGYRQSYFPQIGDGPATIADKKARLVQLLESAKVKAGAAAPMIDAALKNAMAQYGQDLGAPSATETPPTDPNDGGRSPDDNARLADRFAKQRFGQGDADAPLTAQQDREYHAFLLGSPTAEQIREKLKSYGVNTGPGDNADEVAAYYADGTNTGYGGVAPAPLTPEQNAEVNRKLNDGGILSSPAALGAGRAISVGFLDEAGAGIDAFGDAMSGDASFKDAYRNRLGVNRAIIRRSEENSPLLTGAGMLAGGLAVPIGAGARTAGGVARVGAGMGALYGVGEGETTAQRVTGGLTGGLTGAALGYGLAKAAPIVERGLATAYTKLRPGSVSPAGAQDIANAGAAEGVIVNRAMVDPNMEAQTKRTGMSVFGANPVRRGMEDVANQIEGGVNRLGRGGTAMEPSVAGQAIQSTAERYIKQSGAVARRQYDRAVKLAGDTRVTPTDAISTLDRHIAELVESPNGAPEALTSLREKLRSGKGFTVNGLRLLRTSLRDQFRSQNMTGSDIERRTMDAVDGLSQDITNGLTAAGKGNAAKAFQSADAAYRQRMDFIGNTVQKLIGKRGANVTPEATFSRFQAMATPKGDEAGLGKMMAEMSPDEAADISATLASTLGRNNKGEFSTALLVSQAQKLPQAAREHIFGTDGAQSLANLATLAREHARVVKPLQGSPTGFATASNAWKTAVTTVAGLSTGYGSSAISGLTTAGAITGGIAIADRLSARALMNTDLTKWLVNASRASTPSSIQTQIGRLPRIAARNPAIANDVLALQSRLSDAFSPARLAANEVNNDKVPVNGRANRNQRNGNSDGLGSQAPQFNGSKR